MGVEEDISDNLTNDSVNLNHMLTSFDARNDMLDKILENELYNQELYNGGKGSRYEGSGSNLKDELFEIVTNTTNFDISNADKLEELDISNVSLSYNKTADMYRNQKAVDYYVNEKNKVYADKNWHQTGASWLYITPFGLYKLLDYIHNKYSNTLPIYITECGMAQSKNDMLTDLDRIHYLSGYLYEIGRLQHETIKGFFVWSLLDNFEWARGYNESFGIINVEYENNYFSS